MLTCLSIPLDRDVDVGICFRRAQRGREDRSCARDKGHDPWRSSFSSHAVRTYSRIFQMHRLDMAYSSSMSFSPPDIFVKPPKRLGRVQRRTNIFHLAPSFPVFSLLSCSCFGPFFYEKWNKLEFHSWGLRTKRLVILDGRHRFSSWKLMDTLTHAKKLYSTLLSFLRSYVNFIDAIIQHPLPAPFWWIVSRFYLVLSLF